MSERAAASAGPLRVLAVTNMYPSASAPSYGVFVKTQMESIESRGNPVEILFVDGSRGPREYLTAFGRVRREARSRPAASPAEWTCQGALRLSFCAAFPCLALIP